MKPSFTRIHPDLDNFVCPGGLFDVEPCDMHLMIGCRGRILTLNKTDGEIHKEEFTVIAVQKNYRGDLCYRVVADSDFRRFGYCVDPDRIALWSVWPQ